MNGCGILSNVCFGFFFLHLFSFCLFVLVISTPNMGFKLMTPDEES